MSLFDYSDDAINTLTLFLGCDQILYVEGDDDVLFWEAVFSHCSDLKLDIRPAGGVNELQPYIDKVVAGDLSCFVAQDSDYGRICGSQKNHPRIIYTYGYSIENTLYSPNLIAEIVCLWSKRNGDYLTDIISWLDNLCSKTSKLFELDVKNFKDDLSIDTGAGHCQQFMLGRTSEVVDQEKINSHVDELIAANDVTFNDSDFRAPQDISLAYILRGHFLQSAVLKYINRTVKAVGRNTNISQDSLYAHAIHFLRVSFTMHEQEGNYYKAQIERACRA